LSHYTSNNDPAPESTNQKETDQHGWPEQKKNSAYQFDNPEVNQLVLKTQRFEQVISRRNMDEFQNGRTHHEQRWQPVKVLFYFVD